jgi:replicative DNA helicase
MSNITDNAKEYLSYKLSVIPTKEDKTPIRAWSSYQKERLKEEEVDNVFSGVKGLAIICGAISGGLEVIDVDTKYDITGSLWNELRTLIQDNLPELYSSLVIAQTKSGGYHIYYRCTQIGGNIKLANRPTTTEERAKNPEDKVRVLIETRGEGGYVIAPTTPGYKFIQGEPGKISSITPQQREIIFSISKSFNEITEEEKPKIKATLYTTETSTGLTPFEDYNNRGDIVGLLKTKGWRVIDEKGDRVNLLRPGEAHSKTSGNFHKELRTLRIWSTSTEFDINKAYSPTQVFSLLECNEDNKLTYRRLLDLGYGEPFKGDRKATTQVKTEQIKVEVVNKVNRVTSVISTPGDSLRIENIQTAKGEEIVISSPGPEAEAEVLKAIALIEETDKRIYVKEGKEPEIRSYQYKLGSILQKYIDIETKRGELTGKDIDSLLDDIIETATRIKEPIDKDIFIKLFTSSPGIKGLGITEESLAITVERLTYTKDKERQAKEIKKLLSGATELQDKGETDKALELLNKGTKEIKTTAGKGLLPTPLSFTTLMDEIATTPRAYGTGYSSLDKFVSFTHGTITLIAGRPSHGKTTLLYNLLLEMSRQNQEDSFYFFTYEEPVKNLSVKLLNRLTATDLSGHYEEYRNLAKLTNYEFIKAYIRDQRTNIKEIEEGKRLLRELIDSQRIKIIDKNYSVEELYSLIMYLNTKEKVGGVFIDYIQRMRTERKTQDKRTEIAHISDQVLQIAKDSGLPIILGAQLNRQTGEKPKLENLKEAGNLEEDANTVISVYNESREKEEDSKGDSYKGVREVELELKILKNREGEVNQTTTLLFDKWTGVIKDQNQSKNRF